MLDSEQYKKNIERWSLFHPKQASLLSKLECKRIEFHTNAKGELNLKTNLGNITYYFHDVEDPAAEAKKWFESLDLKNIQVLIIYGVGLGYYYDAAKEWLHRNSEHYLVFLENDIEVIQRLLQTEKGTEILWDKQVWLTFLDQHTSELDSLASTFLLKPYFVAALNLYKNTNEFYLRALKSKLAFYMNLRLGSSVEYSGHGRNFFLNFFRNLFLLPEAYFANEMFKKFKGVPAIICGAGPSLAKNLHVLQTLRDRALIFAGGTAVNALNTAGFLPHFGIGIDPNPAQFTRLIMNQAFETPFFYRNRMQNDALHIIHGPHLYITGSSGYDIAQFFEEKFGLKGEFLSEGYNVVNFSLSIAVALGCNPIIFTGLDLAYTDSMSYCPGIVNHPLHPRKEFFGTKSTEDELINKEDIHGKPILTLWKWVSESLWFSNAAKNYKNHVFLNATEGGLGFVGVPNVPLTLVADKILDRQFDFDAMVHGEIQNAPLPSKVTEEAIVEALNELLESLKKCIGYCEVIHNDFTETVRTMKDGGELPVNIVSEKGLQALAALEQEPAYTNMLKVFNDNYMQIYTRDFKRLHYDESLLSQHEIDLKKMSLNEGRYNFLLDTAKVNAKSIEKVLEEYSEIHIKKTVPALGGKAAEGKAAGPGEIYSYENDDLKIIDPELNLAHSEKFAPNKDCVIKQFYPDGALQLEQFLKEKLLHGPSTFYSKNGKILARSWFINGQRQGKSLFYYSNGSLAAVQRYRDGKLDGAQNYFYPDGSIKSLLHYSKGQLNGEVLLYYPTGQLNRQLKFIDGKRDGFDRIWNESGMLFIEAEFALDRPVGTARQWYPNGNIAKEIVYEKDSPNFVSREWDMAGYPTVKTQRVRADYFDMVAQQTQKLTKSLEQVLHQLQVVAPIIDQVVTSKKEQDKDKTLQTDLDQLQDQIKHLNEINKKMLFQTGLDPANQQESIWKTPASRKEIEKQVEEMAGLMSDEMNILQKALVSTVGLLTTKIEASKEKEKQLEQQQKKNQEQKIQKDKDKK